MLKVLLLTSTPAENKKLTAKLQDIADVHIVANIDAIKLNDVLLNQYQADCVIMDQKSLVALGTRKDGTEQRTRDQIVASTHQGIQLLPVANIYYFQAEHKYVTAFHTKGQLLIDDSLSSLEGEFAADFIRIHRKTLVAKNKIEKLITDESGKHYLKLYDIRDPLLISRRQLSSIRRLLLCT